MRVIVEVSPGLESKIQDLIRQGKFGDFGQFVNIAMRNQVLAEIGEPSWSPSPSTQIASPDTGVADNLGILPAIPALLSIPHGDVVILPPMPAEEVVSSNEPLWGQFYRYLPLKVAIRVLANAGSNGPVPVDDFYGMAAETAERFRWHLNEMDRRSKKGVGEKLATSFPRGGRRSRLRYISQFLLGVRPSDGRVDGFLSRLVFASVRKERGDVAISPTSWGLEFSRLMNPVIDESDARPLSQGESGFLLRHIAENVKPEHDHMLSILEALSNDPLTGDDLTGKLQGFYKSFQTSVGTWSPGMTDTMRSGATSRMVELGLIRRTRPSRGVPFQISDRGREWLRIAKRESKVGGGP